MDNTPAPKPTLMTVQGDLKATIRKLMAVAADSRGHANLDSFDERLVSGHVEAAIVLLNLAWATVFAGAKRENEREHARPETLPPTATAREFRVAHDLFVLKPGKFYVALNSDQGDPFYFIVKTCPDLSPERQGLFAWGFSVYQGRPGYRTLGIDVTEWLDRKQNCHVVIREDHDRVAASHAKNGTDGA